MTIELDDLVAIYSEETVEDIINHWQNDIFTYALVCPEHFPILLQYKKGQLYCPIPNCQYHQHWIAEIVLRHWNSLESE
jgi:hypothetical protein